MLTKVFRYVFVMAKIICIVVISSKNVMLTVLNLPQFLFLPLHFAGMFWISFLLKMSTYVIYNMSPFVV
jgi:hypothetical protein